MTRTMKIAVAAVVFLGVCLGVPYLGRHPDQGTAFAQVVEQIEKAKTITWKQTFYDHVTSKDGQRTWVETETREMAYKAPGLYREVLHPTIRGQIEHTCITDAVNLQEPESGPCGEKSDSARAGRAGEPKWTLRLVQEADERAGPAMGGKADNRQWRGQRLSQDLQDGMATGDTRAVTSGSMPRPSDWSRFNRREPTSTIPRRTRCVTISLKRHGLRGNRCAACNTTSISMRRWTIRYSVSCRRRATRSRPSSVPR